MVRFQSEKSQIFLRLGVSALGTRLGQHHEAVQTLQGQVQHHHIGLCAHPLLKCQCAVTTRRCFDASALECTLQRGLHGGVVFDQ
jgi:hypothetical protein